jgi:hypothetical protein
VAFGFQQIGCLDRMSKILFYPVVGLLVGLEVSLFLFELSRMAILQVEVGGYRELGVKHLVIEDIRNYRLRDAVVIERTADRDRVV